MDDSSVKQAISKTFFVFHLILMKLGEVVVRMFSFFTYFLIHLFLLTYSLLHELAPSLLLLKDGCCQWPGCEKSQLLSKNAFQLHLNNEHSFGQCSAAQV